MFGSKPFGTSTTSSTFGAPASSSLFGQKPAGSSLFGTTTSTPATNSLWGQQKPASGGGLFGSSGATQQSSLFGNTSTSTASTSLFGGSTQNKSLFGGAPQNTSTFGSPSASTGLFGGSTSTSGGGLFGGSTAGTNGTTIKFEPTVGSDTMIRQGTQTNISTKNICITAMKQYENKSMEELRMEDYLANRKTPAAGSTTGGSLFGSSSATNNAGTALFGSPASQKNIFGSSPNSTFGAKPATASTGIFGSPQQQNSGSLFGASKPSGGLFGNTSGSTFGATPAASTSLFGGTQQQQQSTFGQPANTGGLFGSTAAAPAFGAATAQPSTGFTFGGGAGTTSTFGQANTSGGLFGSSTAPTAAATGGGLFGSKPAAGGTFFGGGTTTNTFGGASNTGGGLFGSTTANKPLFGSPSNTGGTLFGGGAQAGGGLFGGQQAQQVGGTLFGGGQQQTVVAAPMPAQVSMAAAAPIVLGSDVNQRQVERALFEAQLAAAPYGDGPLLKWMNQTKEDTEAVAYENTDRQLKFLQSLSGSPLLSAQGTLLPPSLPRPGTGAASDSAERSPLVVKDLSYTSLSRAPTLANGIRNVPAMNNSPLSSVRRNRNNHSSRFDTTATAVDTVLSGGINQLTSAKRVTNVKHLDISTFRDKFRSPSNNSTADPDELPRVTVQQQKENIYNVQDDGPRPQRRTDAAPPKLLLDSSIADDSAMQSPAIHNKTPTSPDGGRGAHGRATSPLRARDALRSPVSLENAEYRCVPTIEEIQAMTKDGVVELPDGLSISRQGYGSVFWRGPLILKRELKLEEIVVFRNKEVTVYPDDSTKPEVGQELNRPAEVTLERVWPVNKETKEPIKDVQRLAELRWRERLETVAARMGATFKDYRPNDGSWVFCVDHF
ncbi:unnamed protein product, partial [Mesorhabditis spiculigera]